MLLTIMLASFVRGTYAPMQGVLIQIDIWSDINDVKIEFANEFSIKSYQKLLCLLNLIINNNYILIIY